MSDENGKVEGYSVYSSLVFRLAGPRINLAVRHFQSFIPILTLKRLKKLETVHAHMQLRKMTSAEKIEVLKF